MDASCLDSKPITKQIPSFNVKFPLGETTCFVKDVELDDDVQKNKDSPGSP